VEGVICAGCNRTQDLTGRKGKQKENEVKAKRGCGRNGKNLADPAWEKGNPGFCNHTPHLKNEERGGTRIRGGEC